MGPSEWSYGKSVRSGLAWPSHKRSCGNHPIGGRAVPKKAGISVERSAKKGKLVT